MKHAALAFWVVSVMLTGCSHRPDEIRTGRDLTVVKSPNGAFQVIVREVNIDGSVMVSQPYQVILQSLTSDAPGIEAVLIADKTDPLVVAWGDRATLLVCYSDAHIYGFNNHFYFGGQQSPLQEITVELLKRGHGEACTKADSYGA